MNVFIGMGYVGLTTALAFDTIGLDVQYYDIDRSKILKIQERQVYIYEPGLQTLMSGHTMTELKHIEDIPNGSWIFVCVGTPEGRDGHANLDYVFDVMRELTDLPKGHYEIVLKSTCPPGTSDRCIHILEDYGKWQEGIDFDFYYCPEFLREGTALDDTFKPDKVVIGAREGKHLDLNLIYDKLIKEYCGYECVYTNRVNAEIIKYANNAFLATKISFINQIAKLCEHYPGADVYEVADAIGKDKRIGRAFLNAGIGFGGSCFPKDVKELEASLRDVDESVSLIDAVLNINESQHHWAINILTEYWNDETEGKKVALLGVAFKPNTDDIRYAPAVYIKKALERLGVAVVCYDPVAKAKDFNVPTVKDAIRGADAVIICTEWEEFKKLEPEEFIYNMKTPLVIDGRRIYNPVKMTKAGIKYFGVGFGNYE